MVSCVLFLVADSSTVLDFKPYLICKRGVALSLEQCLKQLREAKNMKPSWKVRGFEKQTFWKIKCSGLRLFLMRKTSKNSDADVYICMKRDTVI